MRLRDELRRRVVAGDADEAEQLAAIDTLAELRDAQSIPALLERLIPASSPVAARAHDALRTLAAQDFALSRRRWLSWWQTNQERPRVAWLLDGLGHRTVEVRALALAELRALAGQDFGYAADAPKRERDAARERWREWASAQAT